MSLADHGKPRRKGEGPPRTGLERRGGGRAASSWQASRPGPPLFSRLLMSFQVGTPASMKQMTFWARFCSQQAPATVTDWLKHED